MIQEDYCSYEVAKLLKEKGFRAKCNRYYNAQYDETRTVSDTFIMDFNDEDLMKVLSMEGAFNIPTHQMAMKWLREVHKVFFCVHPDYPISKDYMVEFYDESRPSGCFGNYPTYEESVEAALKYSLENLI